MLSVLGMGYVICIRYGVWYRFGILYLSFFDNGFKSLLRILKSEQIYFGA